MVSRRTLRAVLPVIVQMATPPAMPSHADQVSKCPTVKRRKKLRLHATAWLNLVEKMLSEGS